MVGLTGGIFIYPPSFFRVLFMRDEVTNSDSSGYINPNDLAHNTEYPHTKISLTIDKVIESIGGFFSWVWVVLMFVIIINVLMRYVFHQGLIEFEEGQWHLYSIGWLIGLSYCFIADEHVRVDLFHERMSLVGKAWVEFLGMIFLLLPFIILVLIYSVPFVNYSWQVQEISDAPGGLPYRWAIKAFLVIGFVLLLLAFFSRLIRVIYTLYLRYVKGLFLQKIKNGVGNGSQ
jgi:TRAP-type mannitol/chloroaromatic compound transport system permease small subunit